MTRSKRLGMRSFVLVVVIAGLLVPAAPASAATIPVGCSAADLIAAVEAANATAEGDRLSLAAGCTYPLTSRYGTAEWALPTITGGLIINGNGATIERAEGSPSFGIARVSGDLFVSNVTLREFWGFDGAYFGVSGSLVLVNSVITNTPPIGQQEAAIKSYPSADIAIVNSTISNQNDIDSGRGGAIENAGDLVVHNSTFMNNRVMNIAGGPALQAGGAIWNAGTAKIFDSTFTGNTSGAVGGAIANSGYLEIHDSTFENGRANFGAAIYNSGSSDLIVEDSYFAGNDANFSGGAIYNSTNSLATVRNSSFYRNRAQSGDGGAVLNSHGTRIEYSTFSENTAGGSGGDTLASSAGLIRIEASILSGAPSHCSGSMADFDHNVVHPSRGSCPSGFTVGNPQLSLPAMRGGGTKTMALGAGSAAFNAVPVTGCPATDQRGRARPAGSGCDAGALEDQPPTTPGAPSLAPGSATPNRGTFGLTWSGSTDPDGLPVTYQLYHRDEDDVNASFIASPSGPSYTFGGTPETEGTYRYGVFAVDGNFLSTFSSLSSKIVVDRSAPSAPTASADRTPDYASGGGWYHDTVTVSFTGSTDPALQDGSDGSGVASITEPQVRSTSGTHTVLGNATDAAGNVSPNASLVVNVDAEAPDVSFTSCPADVILGSVTSATWTASDVSSGLETPASGSFVLDTSSIGSRSVVANATDNVGHSASATCNYRVVYDFSGFFKPLSNPPALNPVAAGDAVRLTFGLAGNHGLAIIEPGYPQSAEIACAANPELTTGAPTTARRAMVYTSNKQGGRYTYFWGTETGWAGTCRQVIVKLVDGTYHRANVQFS